MYSACRFVALSSVVLISLSSTLRAEILAAWNPQGLTDGSQGMDWTATSADANIILPFLSRQGSLDSGDFNTYGIDRYTIGNIPQGTNLNDFNYVTFSIAPQPGYQMTLTSLDFSAAIENPQTKSKYIIRYGRDIDGGDYTQIGATALPVLTDSDLILNTAAISGIANTSDTIEFRIYPYGAASDLATGSIASRNVSGGADGLIVHGSVVPEPGTLALLSLGAFTLLRRKVRKN